MIGGQILFLELTAIDIDSPIRSYLDCLSGKGDNPLHPGCLKGFRQSKYYYIASLGVRPNQYAVLLTMMY